MWATAEYSIHTFRRFSARWKVKKKKCSSIYLKHSRGVGNRFHVWHKLVEPHLVSLLLKEKRSNMTGGVYLCSPLSISHWAAQAWLTRKSPRQAENSSETPQLNPCWNIRASIPPPRGSPFKQCKAIFYQHPSFSKAALMPGECITAASWAHLPEQHLGGHSRFLSGSLQEGSPRLATVTKNPSSAIMSWWSLKIILAPTFEVRRSGPIRIQTLFFCFYQHSIIKYWSGWKRSQNSFLFTSADITKRQ